MAWLSCSLLKKPQLVVGARAATTLYRPGTNFDESDLSVMFAAASVALVVTMGAGGTARVGGKGAPTAQPTAKNFALKDPLKSDVCLMASENRAIVGRGGLMKILLPSLMLALSLITSIGRATIPKEPTMNLSSTDFGEGGNIPERFTCEGKDMSPTLKIDGVPKEAKSLVLIVDDPDAPGGNFTHWLMWNVVPDLTEIAANRPPSHAVQGVNDFGKSKYSGPCPPPGIHRYYFKLYALDTTLALPPTSKRKAVDSAIKGHILGEATLVGRYARKGNKR